MESGEDLAVVLLLLLKYPAPLADHQPFFQLGEVIREARPVHNEVILAVVIYVDGGDHGGVINVFDFIEECSEAA